MEYATARAGETVSLGLGFSLPVSPSRSPPLAGFTCSRLAWRFEGKTRL